MKKIITIMSLCFFVTFAFAQKKPESRTKIIVASYDGNASDTYFFNNNENNTEIKFKSIESTALAKYDLKDKSLVGKYFRITYRIDFIASIGKKRDDKLAATQSAYTKELTIVDLEELVGFNRGENNKDKN